MGRRAHSPVSLTGWPLFAAAALLALVCFQFSLILALFFCLIFITLLYLFRDPWRSIPADPLAVVSPIDGHVVEIAPMNNPQTDHLDQRITIDFSKTGAYAVHSVTEGKITALSRNAPNIEQRGKNITALSIVIRTDEQDDVVMVVHRGHLGHYPKCYHHTGERVGQGRRVSYIPFGRRVDVYIPDTSRVDVKVGDRLVAGESVLAHFVH